MRPDNLLLADILECNASIKTFIAGKSEAAFVDDRLIRSAVLSQLIIIGEATSCLTPAIKERHPGPPWKKIVQFRNFVVHVYFAIKWPVIFRTATQSVPEYAASILQILAVEYPEENPPE